MAKRSKSGGGKETARMTIVCNSNQECSVSVKGDKLDLVSAFVDLLEHESPDNDFRNMFYIASKVFLTDDKRKAPKKIK